MGTSCPVAGFKGRCDANSVAARQRLPAPAAVRGSAVDFQLHLETETVEHCYPSKPLCAAPDDTVRAVLRLMQAERTGVAMVCIEGRLLGIFTERDALRLLADGTNLDAPVSQFMVRNPVTLRTSDTVGKAIGLMSTGGFRRLPIIDGEGKILGVVKVSGILHYLVEHFPKVVYTLPPAPHHKTNTREGA
jgi:predicted transcriptional regulator